MKLISVNFISNGVDLEHINLNIKKNISTVNRDYTPQIIIL